MLMSLAPLAGEEDHHQQQLQDESSPQQAVAMTDVGIDLDEVLRTLRSPAPPTPPPPPQEFDFGWESAPDSPSPSLDLIERWLHQQQRVGRAAVDYDL